MGWYLETAFKIEKIMLQPNDYLYIRNYLRNDFGLEISKKLGPLTKSKLSLFSKKYKIENWISFIDSSTKGITENITDDFIDIFLV